MDFQWKIVDFDDFPMTLGNLGVETDHLPKMCAGLLVVMRRTHPSSSSQCATKWSNVLTSNHFPESAWTLRWRSWKWSKAPKAPTIPFPPPPAIVVIIPVPQFKYPGPKSVLSTQYKTLFDTLLGVYETSWHYIECIRHFWVRGT